MSSGGSASLVGRTIAAKFLVVELLGSGAMGDVYRARHLKLDREVALKVLNPSLRHDESFAARFHREARAASRLDHPNCVAVLDYGEDEEGLLYIAMELLKGPDLFEVIHKEWPLPRARVIEIMRQTLAGVAKAHESGIVHRDLKPENIMILRRTNDDGEEIDWIKVCDFGIAKMNDADNDDPSERRLSVKGHLMGTPEYMSPEQARGDTLDVRSDIYALGVVLYQMLVGRVPFEGPTPLDVAVKHLNNEPVPPRERLRDVDPVLEVICLTAMSKDRSQRYQTAREMRAVLRAAQEGRPLSSVAPDATGAYPSLPPVYTPPPPSLTSLEAMSGAARASRSGALATPSGVVGVAEPITRPRRSALWAVPLGVAAVLGILYVGYTRLGVRATSNLNGAGPVPLVPIAVGTSTGTAASLPVHETTAPASSAQGAPASPSKSAKAGAAALPLPNRNAEPPQNASASSASDDAAPPPFASTHTIRATLASGPGGNLRTSIQSRMGGLRGCYVHALEGLGRCASGQATLSVTLNDKHMVATATLSGADFFPSLSACTSMFPGLMIEDAEAQSASFGIAFSCD